MPYSAPTVNYSTTFSGTYTTLTGVQSVQITRGRQRPQDPFPPTICTIELIPANSYTIPLAVGQYLDVRATNTALAAGYFVGKIIDIERVYNFPYNSGSGAAPADRIIITASGGTGVLGLRTVAGMTWTQDQSSNVASSIGGIYGGVFVSASRLTQTTATASAQTYDGALLDAINVLATTGQFLVTDLDANRSVSFTEPGIELVSPGIASATFRDTAGSGYKFTEIKYASNVQNAFTQVQVNAAGLTSQVASTGSAPFTTCVLESFNVSTADALNLATYFLNTNQQTTAVPITVSTTSAVNDSAIALADFTNFPLGSAVTIIFRGSTVTAELQGLSVFFGTDNARFSLFLSPSVGIAFTLDSAAFGVLDSNRLGYS